MAYVNLTAAQAFNSGAGLWILSDSKDSSLLQKLDWYLNFQLSRAQNRKKREMPDPLKFILQECQISILDSPMSEDDHLMVAGEDLVPSHWVIQVQGSQDLSAWVKKIVQLWKSLESPRLRIFLPKTIPHLRFQQEWLKSDPNLDLDLVLES